jgi:exopolyphosphatase/guanosine-5'-triphosphate,3'-diphosphate pyrophosphatase
MTTIVPRWEWRSFGPSFPSAAAFLAELEGSAPQESDELYLLSAAGDNVKVRDDLMDIKVLRHVDGDGLEQWEPIMKAAFPLPAAEVTKVAAALRVDKAPSNGASYSLAEFVDSFATTRTGIRAVNVHKRRIRYKLGKCMAELSEVVADGKSTQTIAVESEDAAAVVAAVKDLGLDGYLNTGYPRGLAALIADTPARYAIVDVGTNSVKFHVGERAADGSWHTVVDRAELTRLGEGLEANGEIGSEAIDRTAAAISAMAAEAKTLGVLAVAAVGTAALRIARNRYDVVAAIRRQTGVTIDVISGEEESRLAFLAVQAGVGLGKGSLAVFDTGGGSTQFTFGRDARVEERFSVDVGAVRYTERFGLASAVSRDVLRTALAAISADLSRIDGRPQPDVLVAMGGTVTNITAVKHRLATYDPDVVQGSVLRRAEIDRQIELYSERDAEARRSIVGLQPKRADVILAGALIVRAVMEKLGVERFTVSDRSLRHGLIVERFGQEVTPANTAATNGGLTASQSGEVIALLGGVDSVELKVSIPAPGHQGAIKGLPLDPVEAEPRQVFFFDTPNLDLNRAGVVVRARRIRGGGADTVVKLRPVVPSDLPDDLRRSGAFKVELDALPGGYVCSGSLKGKATGDEVNAVVDGEMSLRKLLSKEQRAFFAEHAPAGLDLDELVPLGPTFLLKSRFFVKKLDRKVVAEYWLYPDGSRILELSTKCEPSDAFQVAAEFRAYLTGRGIDITGVQETKTKMALEFFSARLRGAAAKTAR